jgi:homospermidine synthase
MMKNPQKGLCVPDDLPYEEILAVAQPYLGDLVSQPIEWTPLDDRKDFFRGFAAPDCCDYEDPWQFKNFRVTTL